MQIMKDNSHFNSHVQKSSSRSFEIIEFNVDEPIKFQKGKWSRQLFERNGISSKDNTDKNEKRKIMLVIPR